MSLRATAIQALLHVILTNQLGFRSTRSLLAGGRGFLIGIAGRGGRSDKRLILSLQMRINNVGKCFLMYVLWIAKDAVGNCA